jgi:hypothetical protein
MVSRPKIDEVALDQAQTLLEIESDRRSLVAAEAEGKDGRRRPRSRVFRHNAPVLPTDDGRSVWARIRRDCYFAILAHCGGEDVVTETQKLAIRRLSTFEAELIFCEDKFAAIRANGDEPDSADIDIYGRMVEKQRRLCNDLGWARTSRNVNTLSDLLRHDRIRQQQQTARDQSDVIIDADEEPTS